MDLTILRAGVFTDSNGREVELTVTDLQALVDAYDPDQREAPITLGHPTDDAPAYGWVESLRMDGERVAASVRAVHQNVKQWIEEERYRYLSASLFDPKHSETGTWYLRHVGLLGAAPPAVSGLGPVELASDDEGIVMLCGNMPAGVTTWADVLERLRQWKRSLLPNGTQESPPLTDVSPPTNLAAMESLPEMLSAFISDSDKDESELIAEMAEAGGITAGTMREIISGDIMRPGDDVLAGIASVVDDVTTEELMEMMPEESTDMSAREARLRARDRRLKAREQRIQKQEEEARKERAHSFADGLADKGKILPRHVPTVAAIYQAVDDSSETVDLSAHDGGQVSAKEAVGQLFDDLGETIDFSEASAADSPDLEEGEEQTAVDLAKEARAYQAERLRDGEKISTAEAVHHVKSKQ